MKATFRPRRAEVAALAGILALGAALRLVGSRYGLPYPVLNPDEASIVPRGWEVVHGGGLDPGWYDYPSLVIYLVAPFQAPYDEPSYGAARVLAIGLGLIGVAAAWWLGRLAYGRTAGIVAAAVVAVATTHVAYSRMAVTDVALTLGVTCALALALSGRLELAGLAAGLAVSAKYPGVMLAVPLLVAGWGEWRRLGRAAALAAGAFALTSPFVLVHAAAAWDDVSRVQRLARAGWLGFEDEPAAPIAFLERLWESLGPVLAVAIIGLLAAVRRRRRTDLALVSFALAYWLYLLPLEAHFDRYVLPLVPVLGALAGSLRLVAPVAVALLAVPLVWSIDDAADLTRTDTRVRAAAWIDEHVPVEARIAADPSTLPLPGRRVVRLELPGPDRPFDPQRNLRTLAGAGVRWVLVSGAVADRVRAARGSYPREARFYDELERRAAVELAVDPDEEGLTGPWVRVYSLGR